MTDLEGLRDGLRKSEDETERGQARRQSTVLAPFVDDEDFEMLHDLVNRSKAGDADVKELRRFVNDHYDRAAAHRALDRVLDRLGAKRNCAGDRFRGVRR